MNDMEKQMRELALEMFEIKEKIESAKRADLPDKIRDFAIKELNERYEDKYDQFHNLEISYNTEMYKINSAKLKEKYEARAAEKQKAFDDAIAETQKRNNYILEFIKQDPSARVTYNRTNDLSYIDKMYGPQIDMFIRHQEEALKEPVVVNEEQVIEPVVGVPETVIPEVKNEEVSVGDVEPVQEPVEQTEENESAVGVPETVIPEVKNEEVSVGNVEPVQEPVEQTEENESANQDIDLKEAKLVEMVKGRVLSNDDGYLLLPPSPEEESLASEIKSFISKLTPEQQDEEFDKLLSIVKSNNIPENKQSGVFAGVMHAAGLFEPMKQKFDALLSREKETIYPIIDQNKLTPEQQQETENSVIQNNDLKEAMTVAGVTEQNHELTPEQEVETEDAVMNNPELQSANEQAQSMTTDTSASDALNDMSEGNYDNTPEPRKAVASIKQAGKALIDAISKHKKGALIALGAIGAVALIPAVPALGFAAVVGTGAAAVHEFNKGRKG